MVHPYEWSDARRRAAGYGPDRGGEDDRARDPANFDRYGPRVEAEGLGEGLERGWRRLSEGVRRSFADDRAGVSDRDTRRAGGMFGGHDRPSSAFSHGEGLGEGPGVRRAGPHRGKGPRGYVRSDARILEDVSDRLADDGQLDATDIEVKVEAGEVTLDGQVQSRDDKRRAEALAERASGVRHVQNNLRVRSAKAAAEADTAAPMAGAAIGSTAPTPPARRR
jgi:hypothetical protein